jgi:type IV fimbrial biogenesis protein FimT
MHHLSMTQTANQQGHSLLDTMFALFVVALLCGVAASAMQGLQTSARLQTAAQELHSAVLTARTQALRLEKRVTLCAAATSSADRAAMGGIGAAVRCHVSSDGPFGNVWRQGWLMFEDDNNNGIWDEGEVRLAQHETLHPTVSASGNATVNHFVSFGASGRSLALNGAFQAGTLTVCERRSQNSTGWHVVVNAVGRPRLEKLSISNCAG